jgi:hypothetical protein
MYIGHVLPPQTYHVYLHDDVIYRCRYFLAMVFRMMNILLCSSAIEETKLFLVASFFPKKTVAKQPEYPFRNRMFAICTVIRVKN